MSDDFEREERAFAEALHASVPVESFRPLDAEAIKAAAGPARPGRTRWLRTLAAAAVLVVTVGVGAALLPRMGAAGSSVPAEPGYAAGGAVPETAQDRGSVAAQPTKADNSYAGEWTTIAASPLSPRVYASGGWFDGRFYIVGGRVLKADCPPSLTFCAQDSNNLTDGASYDLETDSWQRLPDSPRPVGTEAPVAVGSRLYYSDSKSETPVAPLAFATATSTWEMLPAPAAGGQLVAAGERLVSIGGHASGNASIDQILDPVTNTWSDLPTGMFTEYEWRRGVYADGQIVVGASGPTQFDDPYARFEALDLATNTWHELAQPKIAGAYGTRVGDYLVINDYTKADHSGKKYANGARYNLLTRTWSDLPAPTSTVRTLPDAYGQVVGNRILIKSQLFDPADGSWTPLTSPNPKVLHGMTVIGSPGGLLVFGGEDHDKLTANTYYLPAP